MVQRLGRLQPLVPFVLIVAVIGLIFTPLFSTLVSQQPDFTTYIQWAQELLTGRLHRVHILFNVLQLAFQSITGLDWITATIILMVVFSLAIAYMSYLWLRSATPSRSLAILSALTVVIVAPITVLTWSTFNHYFGYIGINVLHSPTMVLLRLTGLVTFIFTILALQGKLRFNIGNVLIGAVLVVCTLFSKPNFALVMLPALICFVACRAIFLRTTAGLRLSLVGLIIPMLIVLPLQYIVQYTLIPEDTPVAIIFAPLGTVSAYEGHTPVLLWLLIKFLLSITFPLTITVLYRRAAFADTALNLGWLMFAVGAIQMYFFAESDPRFGDGNFWWSGQIGLFLLFVSALRVWVAQVRLNTRTLVSLAVLGLHILSGVVIIMRFTRGFYEGAPW